MTKPNAFKYALCAASAAMLFAVPAGIAQETTPVAFSQFSTSAETSSVSVNYQPIAQFSSAFGNEERGRTKIAYAAVEKEGKRFLAQYKNYLSRTNVSQLSHNDQLAFWLNTRNMLIMEAMADSRSRRKMSSARGTPEAPGPMWTEKRITIAGTPLSIHDIEQDIILANFSENPNVIFGLYQGTSGGPGFPKAGFSASNLEAELEAAGREFIDSRNGLKVRRTKAQLPAIYAWYSDAVFGGDDAAARQHVAGLASERDAAKLNAATQFETRKFSYSSDEYIIRQQAAPTGGFGGAGAGGGGGGGS